MECSDTTTGRIEKLVVAMAGWLAGWLSERFQTVGFWGIMMFMLSTWIFEAFSVPFLTSVVTYVS